MMNDLHNALLGLLIAGAVFLATYIKSLTASLKKQTQNGDGRTLRKAVDDLADIVKDHRDEYRMDTKDTKERLSRLEETVFLGTKTGA